MDISRMDARKKHIYSVMWGSDNFSFPVKPTPVSKGRTSSSSYSFTDASTYDEKQCCDRLTDLFGIADKELFREKFHQACSGDGGELKRISRLHSSALCALLFFYGVSENNPLTLTLNGEECVFTYSRFEFQTRVVRGRNPSNMDVVLTGRNSATGKNVILFLESKFSEYVQVTGRAQKVALGYLETSYSKDIYRIGGGLVEKIGLTTCRIPGPNPEEFLLKSGESCYLGGIKQMISHFVGINNFIAHGFCDEGAITKDSVIEAVYGSADVFLGEILFDKGIGDYRMRSGKTCFESYSDLHGQLVDILKSLKTPVIMVDNLLLYSMFEGSSFIREDKIREFYFESGASGSRNAPAEDI